MKDVFFYTTLVLAAALAVVAGLYYGEDVKGFVQTQSSALSFAQKAPEPEPRFVDPEVNSVELEREFEDILNGFLLSLKTEFTAYKKQRKVVDELIEPFNLREPAYVEQNHEVFKGLVPDLRDQMEKIIATFSLTDQKIMAALDGHSERMKAPILEKWKATKFEQSEKIIDYLNVDDKILTTYGALLAFYNQNKDSFIYSLKTERIVFADAGLEMAEQTYHERIDELVIERRGTLKKNI